MMLRTLCVYLIRTNGALLNLSSYQLHKFTLQWFPWTVWLVLLLMIHQMAPPSLLLSTIKAKSTRRCLVWWSQPLTVGKNLQLYLVAMTTHSGRTILIRIWDGTPQPPMQLGGFQSMTLKSTQNLSSLEIQGNQHNLTHSIHISHFHRRSLRHSKRILPIESNLSDATILLASASSLENVTNRQETSLILKFNLVTKRFTQFQ